MSNPLNAIMTVDENFCLKEEAKKLIDKLPDNATWDDIMYELYVKKKIAAGLKAAEEGKVVSHADAKKRLLSK